MAEYKGDERIHSIDMVLDIDRFQLASHQKLLVPG
jgi:hypothetical protein